MSKVIGIVKIEEISGYTLMLQEYEEDYYLRVEDDGNAVLKVSMSRRGEVLEEYKTFEKNEQDFTFIKWAQNLIKKEQVK